MITGEYLRCMGLYNRWQNDLLYACCARLDDDQRAGDHGLFFRSIHHTLDHITLVDDAILDMVRRGQAAPLDVDRIRIPDFAELRNYRTALDEEIQDLHHQFDTRWLGGKASPKFRFSRGLQLTQMFNHQTHHRSQVTAQLHRLGVQYGTTDLPHCPYL
ncbi:MAG TPA: DinB family protein [Polyangiales bacterium]